MVLPFKLVFILPQKFPLSIIQKKNLLIYLFVEWVLFISQIQTQLKERFTNQISGRKESKGDSRIPSCYKGNHQCSNQGRIQQRAIPGSILEEKKKPLLVYFVCSYITMFQMQHELIAAQLVKCYAIILKDPGSILIKYLFNIMICTLISIY